MDDQSSPTPFPSQDVTRPATGRGSAAFINHYRLLQRLGEGGMGEVWLAEQVTPVRRQVAIKVIKAGMDTAHVVARFEAERQALALLDHPAIARVFDGGATAEGRPYFVMEYVKGEADQRVLRQKRAFAGPAARTVSSGVRSRSPRAPERDHPS